MALQVEGERILFKISYYDRSLIGHSPDHADPSVTTRVLTVMLAGGGERGRGGAVGGGDGGRSGGGGAGRKGVVGGVPVGGWGGVTGLGKGEIRLTW